jgi:hypothetical protein
MALAVPPIPTTTARPKSTIRATRSKRRLLRTSDLEIQSNVSTAAECCEKGTLESGRTPLACLSERWYVRP